MSGSTNFTQTPNIALYKPTFNADVDAWGGHWNANADTLDNLLATTGGTGGTFLPLAGGTMTGPLTMTAGALTAGTTVGSTSRPGFLAFAQYIADTTHPWFIGGNWGFGWRPATLANAAIRPLSIQRDCVYAGSLVGANPGALQITNNVGANVTGMETGFIATVNTSATAGLAVGSTININKSAAGSGAIVLNVVADDQSARMSSIAGGNVVQENDLNGSGPDDAFIRIGMEATFKESPTGGPSPDGASTFFYGGIRCRGGAVNSAQTGFTNPPATATYAFGATTFAPGQGGLVGRFVTPFLADGCSGAAYSAVSATQTLQTSTSFSAGVSAISLTNTLPFPSYVWPGALVTGTGIQANTHVVTSSWNGSNTTTISLDKVTSGALTSGQVITFTNAIGTGFQAGGYLTTAAFTSPGFNVSPTGAVTMQSAIYGTLPVNAANDAAALAAGVAIGGVYRNGSVLQIRVI